ncbi:MAG: hypothetical protein AAGI12_15100 [Pseudomonadota bacterium]
MNRLTRALPIAWHSFKRLQIDPRAADLAIEFVQPDSDEGAAINRVLLKETEKSKYRPMQVVAKMQEDGYPRFTISKHTDLWKALDAKNAAKGYGVEILDGQWYWYETWIDLRPVSSSIFG